MLEYRLDELGEERARHRSGCACVEVSHERDRLLAVERAGDQPGAGFDQIAQLGGGAGHLDLEIADERDLAREADQERHREVDAAQWCVLDHDG